MRSELGVRVRRWRRSMSGCAWRVDYSDGSSIRWIESPVPRTPISLAIFLHECGHHAIGFNTYRLRCEEEYHCWLYAIARMREFGVQPDEKVWRRVQMSMRYAVGKAIRRGLKSVPDQLVQFLPEAA